MEQINRKELEKILLWFLEFTEDFLWDYEWWLEFSDRDIKTINRYYDMLCKKYNIT